MRVLLVTAPGEMPAELVGVLEAGGHEIVRVVAEGGGLLPAICYVGEVHAAVVSQRALGQAWTQRMRELREQLRSVPVILLLRPRAREDWNLAMLHGAFDALPASAGMDEQLDAVARALRYASGARPRAGSGTRSHRVAAGTRPSGHAEE